MAALLPIGLTYLLPSNGDSVTLTTTDLNSPTGKVGPLLLKLTNSSDTDTAVVSYDNGFVPGPPPGPTDYTVVTTSNQGPGPITCIITVNTLTGTAVCKEILDIVGVVPVNTAFPILGTQIGGTSPANNLTFVAYTSMYDPVDPSYASNFAYANGTIPTNTPNANAPTYGNPSKVFTIAPLTSELVQIPSSDSGSTMLVASGASLYVTPVQIIA